MGSSLSPTLADIVMEDFENTAINTFQYPVTTWKRYVDDTFVIIKKDLVDQFFTHINSIDVNIQFTLEKELNN